MTADKQSQDYQQAVELLIFGAHPDDVEWGAGGTILPLKAKGMGLRRLPRALVSYRLG
jgi:LmbE family N-acetylglucosaminyl deacetylase